MAGEVPEGRHACTLDEFEATFVLDSRFATSSTRQRIFEDFLAAIELLRSFDEDLLERAWIGGGFASAKLDPSDIDVTFVLDADRHRALSGRKRDRIAKLCRKNGFEPLDLLVDGFFFARERFANPWQGGGVAEEARGYATARGAWDDWWTRSRNVGGKDDDPRLEDADPVRGYVEVIFDGAI
ncbi:hypothetical protein DEI93_09520 [Curtobacterium sp. MCBD17_035]|uniref:DUF6932 family protein n=1 Tax=Curtobacterium sp. MCBD17_035 TaxID=2175673 RepID=UPI000DAA478A|nr:hypothetical protein [Curtobacterium sp. MCBD17_035]WIB66233.1 hypothetical protein DEI93_09520 [Curtobacterium sp. MCBD17_035]